MYVPNRWLTYVCEFWPNFLKYTLGIPYAYVFPLVGTYGLVTIQRLKTDIRNKKILMLWLSFGIQFLMLRYYWGERFMGYLQYFYPYLFFFTASTIFFLIQKGTYVRFATLLACVFLLYHMGQTSMRELKKDDSIIDIQTRTNNLLAQFPDNQTFAIYNCRRSDFDRTQAIAYTLLTKNKLSPSGRAIGLPVGCPLPPSEKADGETFEEQQAQLTALYPLIPTTDAIDIQEATEGAKYDVGYRIISPESVYESTVRWWFHEQP
jgi:hypothetical protein